MKWNSEDNLVRTLNISEVLEGDHEEPSNAKSVAVQRRKKCLLKEMTFFFSGQGSPLGSTVSFLMSPQ